ncbi:MAG: GSCFA domain-containing protein, partial [Duncaniella sp.]|nr:GSCFA domain-containing protein [Duncaniella sp.]
MVFRTEIPPLPGRQGTISHGTPLLLIGSCFADNIGERLSDALFDVTVNPFGPLYNPASILAALATETVDDSLFVDRDGLTHHYLAHSRLSRESRESASEALGEAIRQSREALKKAGVVIITLGTTRCFTLKPSGRVVANCHKMPASTFGETRLSPDECIDLLCKTVDLIRRVAPEEVKVIFTVSPVRYLGEGAHGNQLSKSKLLLAVEEVLRRFPGLTDYFPAYEIITDDLRDYRF